jgi:hypothetical protein
MMWNVEIRVMLSKWKVKKTKKEFEVLDLDEYEEDTPRYAKVEVMTMD